MLILETELCRRWRLGRLTRSAYRYARDLAALNRLQRSTDARDDVVPGALFAGRIFEIKTVDRAFRSAREIATTIVDHAFMHRRDREERSGHSHVVDCPARRSVVPFQINPGRFMARVRL